MHINYYYNDDCSCCKGYREVVDKLANAFKLDCNYVNVGVKCEIVNGLKGVPTVRVYNDEGKMIVNSVGNLAYEYLEKMVKEAIDG